MTKNIDNSFQSSFINSPQNRIYTKLISCANSIYNYAS
jgi:hypothetical protein